MDPHNWEHYAGIRMTFLITVCTHLPRPLVIPQVEGAVGHPLVGLVQ